MKTNVVAKFNPNVNRDPDDRLSFHHVENEETVAAVEDANADNVRDVSKRDVDEHAAVSHSFQRFQA